jgi:hypothetical protein
VGLLLEVTPPGGVAFQVEAKTMVSRLQAALVQPGIEAQVKYDPTNLKKVEVVSLDLQAAEAPRGGTDPASRLETLEDLRQKGLISALEYEKKREQILKEL